MARYAIENQIGPVALRRMAASTAQREATVIKGLQWLETRGLVQVRFLEDGEVLIQAGEGKPLPDRTEQLYRSVVTLLQETAAYRQYFRKAEPEFLLG
jgi:hypothetical protein